MAPTFTLDNIPLAHVKHVLFDLGGVHYGVDYRRTEAAFNTLSVQNDGPPIDFSQARQSEVFDDFETGAISSAQFVAQLKGLYKLFSSDDDIIDAWNAMLLGPIEGRKDLLKQAKSRYRIALLSNTNAIHWQRVGPEIAHFAPHFEQLFLSYELGMRKPHPAIFTHCLQQLGWPAAETLFIDDSIQHVQGAAQAGLHAWHLTSPQALPQLLAAQ